MKRTNLLISLVLGLVLILTACTGAAPSGTDIPGLTEVPGLETPAMPGEPKPAMTEEVGTPVDTEEAPAPTEAEPAPTEAEPAPTKEAGPVITDTQSIPSTGMVDAGLVSNLLEFGVFSQDNERLGDTEDLVLDVESRQLTYLVVNIDGKLYPVPWELVTIVTGKMTTSSSEGPQNDFVLSVDKATVIAGPSFGAGELPDTQKMDWDADIQLYWKEFLPAGSANP